MHKILVILNLYNLSIYDKKCIIILCTFLVFIFLNIFVKEREIK